MLVIDKLLFYFCEYTYVPDISLVAQQCRILVQCLLYYTHVVTPTAQLMSRRTFKSAMSLRINYTGPMISLLENKATAPIKTCVSHIIKKSQSPILIRPLPTIIFANFLSPSL